MEFVFFLGKGYKIKYANRIGMEMEVLECVKLHFFHQLNTPSFVIDKPVFYYDIYSGNRLQIMKGSSVSIKKINKVNKHSKKGFSKQNFFFLSKLLFTIS